MITILRKEKDNNTWDEIDDSILKIAKKDWKKAVIARYNSEYLRDYVINEKKRGKLSEFLLEKFPWMNKKTKVLDVGSGQGALTTALARKFDVTGVDTSLSTLKFVEYRTKQEGVKLKLCQIPPISEPIPLKKKEYAFVVLNGVLEWTAVGTQGKVLLTHKNVLKNLKTLIKKNGFLVISIENRVALDWMKGKKSHAPIKFIDLMPRFFANIISRIKRNKDFREHIYTKRGYNKLLNEAGFRNIEFYAAIPTYQKPERIIKTGNPFVNSFVILAQK